MNKLHPKGHILFFSITLARGGAEKQIVHLAMELKERGWGVSVCSIDPRCDYREVLESSCVGVYSLGIESRSPLSLVRALIRFVRIVRTTRPSTIISFMFHANVIGALVSGIFRIPLISSIRSDRLGGPFRRFLEQFAHHISVATVVNSQNATDKLLRSGAFHPKKTLSIANFVEHHLSRSSISEQVFEKGLRWIAVGRMTSQKGFDVLIRAFKDLACRFPESHLTLVGLGPDMADYEKYVYDNDLESSVLFLGRRSDIFSLLQESDAFVLSSRWEGMPNVVMEALSTGTPVVATDVGGVSELVVDGVSGIIVPPDDQTALLDAMTRMSTISPKSRNEMGSAGFNTMIRNHSITSVGDRWEGLIFQVLGSFSEHPGEAEVDI